MSTFSLAYLTAIMVHFLCTTSAPQCKKYPQMIPDAIVIIKNLKPETRNHSIVQQRARMMSNSIGVIMDRAIQINTKNATEVRVRWIGNDSVTLGINPKYLQQFPQIIIHSLPHDEPTNVVDIITLFKSLEKLAIDRVYPVPYHSNHKNILSDHFRNLYPYLLSSLTMDQVIIYDVLATWFWEKHSENATSHDLHVISEESKNCNSFSVSNLIFMSQFLPVQFPFFKIISTKTVTYRSWMRVKKPHQNVTCRSAK